MKTITEKEFLQMIKDKTFVFGKAGIEGLAIVQEYIKEKKEVK